MAKRPSRSRAKRDLVGAIEPTPESRKQFLRKVKIATRTTHKRRAKWFQSSASWPWREAPIDRLVDERDGNELPAARGPVRWTLAGPTNIGGRSTSIVTHPANPDRILLGTAGGGVWRSGDAGRTWEPLWHDRDQNVGALALDPRRPNVVYCGTGEANNSADSYPGVGLFCSSDFGKTWRRIGTGKEPKLPSRIGTIAVDPFDSKHVLLGGIGYEGKDERTSRGGLFFSTDAGRKWHRDDFVSRNSYWCTSIVFHPRRRGWVYCVVSSLGAQSGVYRSKNGGRRWEQLAVIEEPERVMRGTIAIAPSRPDTLYVLLAEDSDSLGKTLGLFRSDDAGNRWRDVAGRGLRHEPQMLYNNTVVVAPHDPAVVIAGGTELYRTQDGGKTWHRITDSTKKRTDPRYTHPDHHALAMPAGRRGRVYDVNDGGLNVSNDGGRTWHDRSNGLAATMFYDVDVAASDPRHFGGGAQDNGTVITNDGAKNTFFEALGADGGWILYNPVDPGRVIATYQNLAIYRVVGRRRFDISPKASAKEQEAVWMTYTALAPDDPKTIYAGTTRVWRTINEGRSWRPISRHFDGGQISAIDVAAADPDRIYIGTENSGFFRSVDRGRTWSANLRGPELPGRKISRIESHPDDPDTIFVTVTNFGHGHVFRSKDGGKRWSDVSRGLPDVPFNAIAIPPWAPDNVYAACDAGVFHSRNGGETWRNLTGDLPFVPVVDLVIHTRSRTLFAATYGRSIYKLAL